MNRFVKMFALTLVAVAALGCEGRTDKVDAGGVILSVTDFDGLPISISASGSFPLVQVESITVSNVARNNSQPTSDLMNVEIHSYEVTYTREDTGTRVPPVLVNHVFGIAPVNGTFVLDGGPILRTDQFNNQPLKDLIDYGRDLETNTQVVRLRVSIQFFGRTLSGDPVSSARAYFTLEVFP
ncbi:MAG: hypothetical protein F9K16_12960 [Thermoanaerobaculia bacterium]|jgi:hypothetical protein|nr:MAG: hypothetical protein F9K16_12960 [Thermoanaerobaculia bacterium]MBZ0102865.1 hypothetical protein [Thermoanaerobaculia bacterium]